MAMFSIHVSILIPSKAKCNFASWVCRLHDLNTSGADLKSAPVEVMKKPNSCYLSRANLKIVIYAANSIHSTR